MLGDYKAKGLVDLSEQQNRLALLRSSLGALVRRLGPRSLDAVVISGDVALKWSKEGFEALTETLGVLTDAGLDPGAVVVVPGNHDIERGSPSSTPERYARFLEHVRQAGFVTPLLEGIDIAPAARSSHHPVLELSTGDAIIVAVNSADLCGSSMKLGPETQAVIDQLAIDGATDPTKATALRELCGLTEFDIARVSQAQIAELQAVLGRYLLPADGGPLRIATLHHQLLPVSPMEEFKAFESITNLGQVREFFAAQQFSVVLHGHKHQAATYVDHALLDADRKWPGFMVSSAATIWRGGADNSEFARLVQLSGSFPLAKRFFVFSLPSTIVGSEMREPILVASHPSPLGGLPPLSATVVGATVDDVYDRVMAYLEADGSQVRHLYCEIEKGATALLLPAGYPEIDGVGSMSDWHREIVGWWQKAEPGVDPRARRFNHGERIRHLQGIDQVDAVVKALGTDQDTTRAVIQLIDQSRDDLGDANQRVPSFFSLQFLVHDGHLDCIGYFRKQQMRMWWPINVAEIAQLQEEVRRKLRQHHDLDIAAGRIATFSAVALDGTKRPRVVVPAIDRVAQENPAEIWDAAYELFFGDSMGARADILAWFADWAPTGEVEPDGTTVALGGLEALAEAVKMFATKAANDEGREVARVLDRLARCNSRYSGTADLPREPSKRELDYALWQAEVLEAFEDIERLLVRIAAEEQ